MCGQSVQHYGLHHHFNSSAGILGSWFFHKRVNSPPTSAAVVHRQNSGVCLLTRKHLLNYMANEPCLLMFVFLHLQGSVSVWKLGRVTLVLQVSTFGKRWAKWVWKRRDWEWAFVINNNSFVHVFFSVDKVSQFKSLTRLRDFSLKSHEIYETFETFET